MKCYVRNRNAMSKPQAQTIENQLTKKRIETLGAPKLAQQGKKKVVVCYSKKNMVSEPKSNGSAPAMPGKKVLVPGPAQEIPKSKCCSSM